MELVVEVDKENVLGLMDVEDIFDFIKSNYGSLAIANYLLDNENDESLKEIKGFIEKELRDRE